MIAWLVRGVRWAARQWWTSVSPARASQDLEVHGDAVAALAAGRTPSPGDRFVPTRPASGPFADVDPTRTDAWVRRPGVLAGLAWMGAVAVHVRRRLR